MRLSVLKSRELLAATLAVRALDKTMQKTIRVHTKAVAEPEWKAAIGERSTSQLQQRVLAQTSVVAVSNQNITVKSAMKGRALRGGFLPKVNGHAAEFGADKSTATTYQRRNRSGNGTHQVTRVVTRGLPDRAKRGHVFWPAAAEMIPRMGALWVHTVVKTIANALEGKQE